ncbi:MAG: chemotaxis protein CheW [Burkholderiales bacterium]|nr:chemotaxis protein CheW [Burkholderiales bacterium]
MTIDISRFYQVFFDETAEHLANMESLLVALDTAAPADDDLNAIFRCAHSIKGGAGTFGFSDMAEVTHALETLLDKIRKHETAVTPPMVDAFLRAGDVIAGQLRAHRGEGEADPASAQAIRETLASLCGTQAQAASLPARSPAAARTLHISFCAAAGASSDNLLAELGALGVLEVVKRPRARKGRAGRPGQWRLALVTDRGDEHIRDLVEFVAEQGSLALSEAAPSPETLAPPAAASAEADCGYGFFDDPAPPAAPAAAGEAGGSYGFFTELPEPVASGADGTPAAHPPCGRRATDHLQSDAAIAGRRQGDKTVVAANADSSIRVSVDKVDKLINLVGELVITQAMLAQTASHVDGALMERLQDGLNQLERNTRDLQESVMSIRMLPISFVFSRFPRVVRDVAAKLGKEVELKTVGEGTELDKGVIEKIADPLTHLVRNSLDHGIELPEVRLAAGKSARGTVTLRAYHQGGNIMVEVSDDGRGLDRARILAKATERGMAVSDAMSDQEVYKLIFAPGFSTAEVVTDVSGRGVGMDVVKRNIEAMGGGVEIDSVAGQGMRISIRLPLTLAILDGLSVRVGKEIYIVPLTYITESLQPAANDLRTVAGSGMTIRVRGEYLPVVSAARLFGTSAEANRPEQAIMVIVEAEGARMALAVDDLVGQHQVVIKSLETNYRRVHGVSGATIMGDGRVALILDVAALVRHTRNPQRLAA